MLQVRALGRTASLSVAVLALVGSLLVFAVVRPGSARAATGVSCTTSSPGVSGELTITISGGSTSSSAPLLIAVNHGDYVIDLNGSPVCGSGTLSDSATSGFPKVVVDSTPATGQYVVLDNTNGQFASRSAVCPVHVTTTASVSGTLELRGDASPAAAGDATIGVGSGIATLATSGCSSDVTPGSGITTLVTKGEASSNALDLSGAPGPLTVDASAAPQKVTGFSGANVTELDFSSEQTVVGPTSGSTKFVAGAAVMIFTGQGSNNALDLSALATSQSTRGTVNVSGGSANSVANNTATAGTTTDQFTAVSSFIGPTSGNTTFLAGSAGGNTFTGQGSGDTLDLSASGSGATIDEAAGSVTIGTATDSFSGIPSVAGPAAGNSRFVAAPSSNNVFVGNGNGNTFVAAPSSNDTINAVGNGNTLDLSAVTAPTLNVSGQQVGGTANNTATAGTSTYSFAGGGISSFIGSSTGATTFFGGTGADTFTGQSTNNTLSYASVSGPTAATLDAHAGTATLGAVVEWFSGIATLAGLSAGNTTFVPGFGGGQIFSGTGTGNTLDLSPLSSPTIDVPNRTLHFGAVTDSFSGVSNFIGSSTGRTTLIAPATSMIFTGQGSNNALDLSALATSQSTRGTVNVSGGSANSVANNTATAGTTTDQFTAVSSFIGPTSGNTTFLAGSAGGNTFTGQGSGDTLDLTAAGAAVKVDAHSGVASWSSTSDGFDGIGAFLVPASGGNTFVAGPTSATFTGGSGNTLDLSPVSGPSSLTVTMAGGNCSAGSVAVTSTGPAPITDCVGGANTVRGASSVATTFRPDPNLTATAAPPVTFVGNDTSSNGSILDLSALTSPDAGGHQVSSLTIAMNGNSNSSPGSVTANVDASPVSFASFSAITELIGSSSLANSFQRGSTTNLTLVGIAKLPQSVTFTSSPPSSAIVGGTYVPAIARGLSQEPVVITIDPSTAGACSAPGGTVRFTAAGTCVIDANEPGNGEFTAAPPARQTVVIHNPTITSHAVADLLATEIVPSKQLRIGSFVKAGGYTLRFKALEAGTASIRWYWLPPGGHLARKQFPVLVAAGKLKFSGADTSNLRLKLTPAGRRLLGHARRITLTAQGTFTPAGAKPIRSVRRFAVRR